MNLHQIDKMLKARKARNAPVHLIIDKKVKETTKVVNKIMAARKLREQRRRAAMTRSYT